MSSIQYAMVERLFGKTESTKLNNIATGTAMIAQADKLHDGINNISIDKSDTHKKRYNALRTRASKNILSGRAIAYTPPHTKIAATKHSSTTAK